MRKLELPIEKKKKGDEAVDSQDHRQNQYTTTLNMTSVVTFNRSNNTKPFHHRSIIKVETNEKKQLDLSFLFV